MPQEESHPGGEVIICLIPHSWGCGGQGFFFIEGAMENRWSYSKQEAVSASKL